MNILFYFTGTGNCLHCAKRLQTELGELELIRFDLKMNRKQTQIKIDQANSVGIILPVYAGTLPYMARDILENLVFPPKAYLYSIATCAGSAMSIHYDLNQIVQATSNRPLDFFQTLKYPSNFQTNMAPKSESEVAAILDAVEAEISLLAAKIKSKKQLKIRSQKFLSLLARSSLRLAIHKDRAKKFHVDSHCIGCGMCEKSCPAENIHLKDKKPFWGTACEACMACIGICPVRAIQYGTKTKKWGRYLNPRIEKKELFVKES